MRLGYFLLGLVALTSIHTSYGQCSNGLAGVQKDDICCDAACGTCGGGGCGKLPGGPDNCCTSRVKESGMMCSDTQAAPCIVEDEPVCSNGFPGVQNGDICCDATCGTCGGSGCAGRPGGSESCCTSRISESGMMCDTTMAAPCIVNPGDVCSNGLPGVQSGDICCDSSCGTCGGGGCAGRPGGSSSCCTSRIRESAVMCDTSLTAPCIVNEDMPSYGCLNPTSRTYKCSFSGDTSLVFDECDLFNSDVPFLPACFEAFGRSNIQRLDFSLYGGISEFPEDIFAGMSELTILQIDNSALRTVQEGLFDGLTKLEFLDMSESSLVSLPEAAFSDLANLQTLNLTYNALSPETLPIGLFSGTPLLQELRLSHNAVEDVTDLEDLLDGLTELTSLELGGDELVLTGNSFAGFENLESLSLLFDEPLTLPEGMFSVLPALRTLKLRSEVLLLTEDTFAGLVSLERLDIGSNGLTTLPAGVFSPVVNLVELNLRFNDLLLTEDAFSGLVNLETLDLESNGLTTLPTGVFSPLANLVNLNMERNDLLLTEDAFSGLVSLETLQLKSSELTTLPAGVFFPLVNLVNLDVSFNFDLQCLPSSTATDIDVSNDDVLDGTCECTPVEAVFCDDGLTCQSGMAGYTCVAE